MFAVCSQYVSKARRRTGRGRHLPWRGVLALSVVLAAGCSQWVDRPAEPVVPQAPPERMIAVAPALNFSGSSDFDPVRVADLFASELSAVPGVGVIGVNRVLAVLADQGTDRIQSPEHAVQVAERLGADAIVVFAITEYDPYTPIVGLAAQVYGGRKDERMLDPVTTSRMARPFPVPERRDPYRPRAQTQRTFNGEHADVQREVRGYAQARAAGDSPYGWRRCLVSQEWFLRFCSHGVIRDLMAQMDGGGVRVAATRVQAGDGSE